MLWNATLMKDHYRSNAATSQSVSTPATISSMSVVAEAAWKPAGNAFWTLTGGATTGDTIVPLTGYNGDIIVRGGKIGIRLVNAFDTVDANRSTIHGQIMLIRTTKNFISGVLPLTCPVGWDVTFVNDFSTVVGKILYKKQFLLRDADTAVVEYRVRTQKIDRGDYDSNYNNYIWVIIVGNVDIAAARAVHYTTYHNISYSADAV